MKTVKTLLKDFLSIMKEKRSQTNINPKQPQKHEAESDENSGVSELDHPDVGKDTADSEKPKEDERLKSDVARIPETDRKGGTEESGESDRTGSADGSGRNAGIVDAGLSETEFEARMKEAVAKAYEEGVVAGRNQQIEEKYFPNTDDGLPQFHGTMSSRRPGSDIFSLAGEA